MSSNQRIKLSSWTPRLIAVCRSISVIVFGESNRAVFFNFCVDFKVRRPLSASFDCTNCGKLAPKQATELSSAPKKRDLYLANSRHTWRSKTLIFPDRKLCAHYNCSGRSKTRRKMKPLGAFQRAATVVQLVKCRDASRANGLESRAIWTRASEKKQWNQIEKTIVGGVNDCVVIRLRFFRHNKN